MSKSTLTKYLIDNKLLVKNSVQFKELWKPNVSQNDRYLALLYYTRYCEPSPEGDRCVKHFNSQDVSNPLTSKKET